MSGQGNNTPGRGVCLFIMKTLIKKIYRFFVHLNTKGVCVCGHDMIDHHGGCIMHDDGNVLIIPKKGVIYQECEKDWFEGMPLTDNPCECNQYWDKGWIFKPKWINNNNKK